MNISYEIMLQIFFISLCHFFLIKKQRTISFLKVFDSYFMYIVFTYCVVDLHVHSIDLDAFLKKKTLWKCTISYSCHRRYMAEILSIRRKTLSNQSINIRAKKA